MKKPKNRTVKTLVTSTTFASMVLAAPAVSHAAIGDQPLKQGMWDQDVKQLQDLLKEKGYYHYSRSTGFFGPITEKAVLAFQKDHHLKTTGVVKSATFKALDIQKGKEVAAHRLIRIGSRGQAVSDLQSRLKNVGFYEGHIDGIYGSLTAAAVRQFQRSHHLQVDGIAGPVTLGVLYGQSAGKSAQNRHQSEKQKAKDIHKENKQTSKATEPSQNNSKEQNNKKETVINTAIPDKLLRVGSRGQAVSELQQKLKAAGLYTYTVDGIYGSRTARAVRQFQRAHHLKVDGIAGPVTLSALYEQKKSASGHKKKKGRPRAKQDRHDSSSSNSGNTVSDRLLTFRDRGQDVTDLQNNLIALGLLDESPSGYYGMATEGAVRQFQKKYGLGVDGIVGPRTRAKLTEVLASKEKRDTSQEISSSVNPVNLIADAADLLGIPYQWGGEMPGTGFDCSGFVQYVFGENGIDLPRTVAWMWNSDMGKQVDNLKPGDVVFFQGTYKNGPSHNGIYIGNGQFIQSGSSHGVTVSNLSYSYWANHYLGAKRFF
ncbi:MAG TPA: peptidoglycan-binding protein [Bacillales bacterium]|nr:peptidoglycan-binding protein [Bacillales bacterium]